MNMEHVRLEESHQYTEFVTFCIKKMQAMSYIQKHHAVQT